jgi:hypothetical protein
METATPGKFPQFHKKIYPIVEYLTSKPEYANHVFTKKWTALKRTPNTPMTANISWRNIKILLGIKEMSHYRDFLVQCPEFTSFVKIQNSKSTRSGFDYGIIHDITNMNSDSTPFSRPSTSSMNTDGESYVLSMDLPPEFDGQTTETQTKDDPIPNDITTTPWQTNVSALELVSVVKSVPVASLSLRLFTASSVRSTLAL